MKKKFLVVLLVILALPALLSARSLLDVSLGFGGSYTNQGDSSFSEGIANSKNWMFGGEVTVRFAIVQAQAMAFPVECADEGQGVLLLGLGSLNLPVLGSLVFLELGMGPSVTYVPSTKNNGGSYYILKDDAEAQASATTFTDALMASPLYLQLGLGLEIGKVGLRVRYLFESESTLENFINTRSPMELFQLNSGSLSLALSLRMF